MPVERAELELRFTTKYEEEGARQALAGLQRQIGAAKAAGESYTALEAKAKKLGDSIAKMSESGKGGKGIFGELREGLSEIIPGFEKVEGVVGKLASGPLGVLAAGFAAVAGAIELAREALKEYAQQEEAVASVNAALAQNQLFTEATSAAYQELAETLQDVTAIADEKWLGVLARLTQFGAKPDQIEDYADAVKNLAGVIGGDISTAGELFSKALQGNFTMLGHYGIHVQEAGTQTQKLHNLMVELAARGGGQLEARAETLNGKMSKLKNAFSDALKGLGGWIASSGVGQSVTQGLTDAFSDYATKLHHLVPAQDNLKNALESTNQAMADSPEAAKKYSDALVGNYKKIADALDEDIKRLRMIEQLMNQVDDAQLALDIAQIEDEMEQGNATPAQGAASISKAKLDSMERKNKRKEDTDREEYKRNKEAIDDASGGLNTAASRVDSIKDKLERQKEFERAQAIVSNRERSAAKAEADYLAAREKQKKAVELINAPAGAISYSAKEAEEIKEATERAHGDYMSEAAMLNDARIRLRKAGDNRPEGGKSSAQLQAELGDANVELDAAVGNYRGTKAQRRRNEEIGIAAPLERRRFEAERDALTTQGGTAVDKATKAELERQRKEAEEQRREQQKRWEEGNPLPLHPPAAPDDPFRRQIPGYPTGDPWKRLRQQQQMGEPWTLPYKPADDVQGAGNKVVAAIEESNKAVLDAFGEITQKISELSKQLGNQRNV